MRIKGGIFHIPRYRTEHLLAGAALIIASIGCASSNDPVCGNNVCEAAETASCPADCAVCGNNVCEAAEAASCPADCAVCGNSVCEANEPTTCLSDCTADMVTENLSGQDVYHLYVAPCGASSWGIDQLGANILHPNSRHTLKHIPPGCYHRRAEAVSTYWQQVDVMMASGQTYTWTLLPSAGAEAAPWSEEAEDTNPEGIEF